MTSLGKFSVEKEYYKDFFLLKQDDLYHLYYNVGTADDHSQQWTLPGNEKCFGHATSHNLRDWEIHPRILPVVPNTWESQVVSAPCIVRHEGIWHMLYTGFDDQTTEWIGLATSTDLFEWKRHPQNPVYHGPAWSQWHKGKWADCRDAHLVEYDDSYLMFTCVLHANGRGAVAAARSRDLKIWEDLGPILETDPVPESPVVFERLGKWYLLTSAGGAGAFISDSPLGPWKSIAMHLPPGWFAWEVLREMDSGRERYLIAAFFWKLNGNFIQFWELGFDGELPFIVGDDRCAVIPLQLI